MPADYTSGLSFSSRDEPVILLKSYSLTVGKVILNKNNFYKINLHGGLLFGTRSEPYDFVYNPPSHFLDLGSNYTYKTKSKQYYGALINPSIYFYTRVVGIKIGACVNVNTVSTSVSAEAGIIIGRIRERI